MSKLRVGTIVDEAGTGAPNFSSGLTGTDGTFTGNVNVTGDTTVTGNLSVGGTITYDDVTNVDSVGIATARLGLKVLSRGVDITAGGVNVAAGIATFAGAIDGNAGANIQGGSGVVLQGLTYPASDGSSGQYLKTDGSGALSFATVASGGGKVLQMQMGEKKNHSSLNAQINSGYASWGDTGISVNITPTQQNSKIYVQYVINGSVDTGNHMCTVVRRTIGGTNEYPLIADSASGFQRGISGMRAIGGNSHTVCMQSGQLLDTNHNTTSQITYRVLGASENGNQWEINSNGENSSGHNWSCRFCSTIAAWEISTT